MLGFLGAMAEELIEKHREEIATHLLQFQPRDTMAIETKEIWREIAREEDFEKELEEPCMTISESYIAYTVTRARVIIASWSYIPCKASWVG